MVDVTTQPVFRFAPSPNGHLHLGHAYSALLNDAMARARGGRFLLRIEDIDSGRSRPEFEAAIYEDLAWLGLAWEEPVRRQSEHVTDYAEALDTLAMQGLLYPCFCSRKEIVAAAGGRTDPDGAPLYPGTCRHLPPQEQQRRLSLGHQAAQRLDMQAALALCRDDLHWQEYDLGDAPRTVAADPAVWGDVVLARKDIRTSYHVAVVVDDALQGISDVVRGADLFHATSIHRLLQALLHLAQPRYHHHPLILDDAQRKLSKSLQSKALRELRREGVTAREIRQMLGLADAS